MIAESKNLNIPNISVSAVVNILTELYSNSIMESVSLKTIPMPFFWGPAGIGKSKAVCQLAQQIEEKTSKTVVVNDARLHQKREYL